MPVVTLVLYFSDEPWKGRRTLKESLSIPQGMENYVQDYGLNIFEIAYLTDEQVAAFKSDFRYVAEYFVQNPFGKRGEDDKV